MGGKKVNTWRPIRYELAFGSATARCHSGSIPRSAVSDQLMIGFGVENRSVGNAGDAGVALQTRSLTLPASMRRPALVNCVFDPTIMKVDRQPTGGPTNRSFSP